MGHAVQAFIGSTESINQFAAEIEFSNVADVENHFSILLVTDELLDAIDETAYPIKGNELSEFWKLPAKLEIRARNFSKTHRIGYFETDYFGGAGGQAAVLFDRGVIAFRSEKDSQSSVNEMLLKLGVPLMSGVDRFESVGLHQHRTNEDWIEQVEFEKST